MFDGSNMVQMLLLNVLTRIYSKLKYTLMSFLLEFVCYVFKKYICNSTF